eukprot:Nk52_evm12s232 gene=Nk52_evmTU12s232
MVLEDYDLLRQIGSGTFGKVLLVKEKCSQKTYALKQVRVTLLNKSQREQTLTEVKVLARLKHPNIIRYKDAFVEDGTLHICMEHAYFGDLHTIIKNRRGALFSEHQLIIWFTQIVQALHYMHDKHILHRDLKTQNVFMDASGVIKLGDFGIARVLDNTLEHARTVVGTPFYLSPELCEGVPYNYKSDIWSLGCVLYEMCTLKHAFSALSIKVLVIKILRGCYPPIPERYSKEMIELISDLLTHDPQKRPSTQEILSKDLIRRAERRTSQPKLQESKHTSKTDKRAESNSQKRNAPPPAPIPRRMPSDGRIEPPHKIVYPVLDKKGMVHHNSENKQSHNANVKPVTTKITAVNIEGGKMKRAVPEQENLPALIQPLSPSVNPQKSNIPNKMAEAGYVAEKYISETSLQENMDTGYILQRIRVDSHLPPVVLPFADECDPTNSLASIATINLKREQQVNIIDDSYVFADSISTHSSDLLHFSPDCSEGPSERPENDKASPTLIDEALKLLGSPRENMSGDDSDSIFCRMEQLRDFLERELTTKVFIRLYHYVLDIDSTEKSKTNGPIPFRMSGKIMTCFPIVLQLVHCEAKWYHVTEKR